MNTPPPPPANCPTTDRPQFFISYCIDDKKFVREVCNLLDPYIGHENMYLFEDHCDAGRHFLGPIDEAMAKADCVIVFEGNRFGFYQQHEMAKVVELEEKSEKKLAGVSVGLKGQQKEDDFHKDIQINLRGKPHLSDDFTRQIPQDTIGCALKIWKTLEVWMKRDFTGHWQPWDEKWLLYGLPIHPHLFDYEKKIIEFYSAKRLQEIIATKGGKETTVCTQPHLVRLRDDWRDDKIERMLDRGVPAEWPKAHRYPTWRDNHIDQELAGKFRAGGSGDEPLVRVAALMDLDPLGSHATFPEAGPRPRLAFPQRDTERQLNVAILVTGGIAPGINAVIDALVQRHYAYQKASESADERYQLRIYGVKNGFLAIGSSHAAISPRLANLRPQDTIENATRGGSMLGTSRDADLLDSGTRHRRLKEIAAALSQEGRMIDILYVIGGDGGMKAAHSLWHLTNRSRPQDRQMAVVTVPKTMDNDILWVWQSFGFLSAVDESRKIVETLHTEVQSNPRLGIVQLFGSDSGFVVSHAVLASAAGHAMLALIPEIKFSAVGVARHLKKRLWETANPDMSANAPSAPIDAKFTHGLVVMAENAVPEDMLECLGLADPPAGFDKPYKEISQQFRLTPDEESEIRAFVERQKSGLRIEGQTSDTVRKLGLRVMAHAIPVFLCLRDILPRDDQFGWEEPNWQKLRVVCSEPRHLVRSMQPSTSDIITGQRLGLLAVDAAMAGYTDCMISQWLTEFAIVPLELVVLGRKRIPPQGMFWKSVISKTGQDRDLVQPYPRCVAEAAHQ